MTFRVIVTENAKTNLRHYYQRAAENAPGTAGRWLNRFHEALQTLSDRPDRCPLAPESDVVEEEIRQFTFGKRVGTFRVLFHITNSEVRVWQKFDLFSSCRSHRNFQWASCRDLSPGTASLTIRASGLLDPFIKTGRNFR